MNLITDSVLTITDGKKVTLPDLFAGMARREVGGFPALRPHQRPAWHMFLVQLGALSLWTGDRDRLPDDAADWTADLQNLTPDYPDDAPWRLFAEERSKPAFLQPPDPGGLKWNPVETPDALDLLITARNHDLKQTVAKRASAEDWVFALVSLQTSAGYDGRGNCGIARMNGGSSSRPMLGLTPARDGDLSINPSAWWARDVGHLIAARSAGHDARGAIGTVGGPALLWCWDWPEGHQLDFRELDPWFVEVCRRVRLSDTNGAVSATRSTSNAARIDAKAFNGNLGDPWAPIHKTESKSLTLGGGDFDYKRICELMFFGDWAVPLLARPGNDERGDMLLVAEALSRGNSKTEGFKSRVVPVPGKILPFFSPETMATFSKAQLDEIKEFDTALRSAIAVMSAGGNGVKKDHFKRAAPASKRFDRAVDTLFFPSLWRRVEANALTDPDAEETAKIQFLENLFEAATAELGSALPAIPCPTIRRPKAEARAWRAFRSRVQKAYPVLFQKEESHVAA